MEKGPGDASKKGHGLKKLFGAIPEDHRKRLERDFRERYSIELMATLHSYEQLFQDSRYPYEGEVDISRYRFDTLMMLSEFLCDYVANLQPIERIAGATASPEYSPSDIQKFQAKKIELLNKAQTPLDDAT